MVLFNIPSESVTCIVTIFKIHFSHHVVSKTLIILIPRASTFEDFNLYENREDSILGNCPTDYSVHPMSESESLELESDWKEEREDLIGNSLQQRYQTFYSICIDRVPHFS